MAAPRQHAFWSLWRGEQPAVASLFVIMLIHFTAVAMVAPAAAFFAMDDIGMDSTEVGSMFSAKAAMEVLAAWACGRLSDSFGRRVCILGCFACGGVGVLLLAFVETQRGIWVAAMVQGLQAGFYPLSDSYILDSVKPEDRPSYTGMYGGAFGVTFTLGNAVGALLLHTGVERKTLFLLGAGISACAVLYGSFTLMESFSPRKRRPVATGDWSTADWSVVGAGLACVWACNFFYGLADGFMSMYPFVVNDLYGWTDAHFAAAMGVVGLCAGLVMVLVFPPLAAYFGAPATLGTGCLCGGIAYALFPQTAAVHLFGLFFFMLAVALFNPSVPVCVGLFAGERHFGFASGVGGAARSAAFALSPLVAGRLYKEYGAMNMLWGSACFLGGVGAAAGVYFSPPRDPEETKPLV